MVILVFLLVLVPTAKMDIFGLVTVVLLSLNLLPIVNSVLTGMEVLVFHLVNPLEISVTALIIGMEILVSLEHVEELDHVLMVIIGVQLLTVVLDDLYDILLFTM
jgi:hypothetical protein